MIVARLATYRSFVVFRYRLHLQYNSFLGWSLDAAGIDAFNPTGMKEQVLLMGRTCSFGQLYLNSVPQER
jgi:hypothetical protein